MSIHSNIDTGNDYHNPLDTFTDREEILGLFQRALHSALSASALSFPGRQAP